MGWHPSKLRMYVIGNEKLKNYESGTWKLNSHEGWNWKLKNHKSCIWKDKNHKSCIRKLKNHHSRDLYQSTISEFRITKVWIENFIEVENSKIIKMQILPSAFIQPFDLISTFQSSNTTQTINLHWKAAYMKYFLRNSTYFLRITYFAVLIRNSLRISQFWVWTHFRADTSISGREIIFEMKDRHNEIKKIGKCTFMDNSSGL
jgi:hypothetical protein